VSEVETKPKLLAGRYQLREPVGEGGMAVVWRAFDTQLKRDVALKVLHDYVPPTDRQRFRREIRTLARLAHPGIISIYDLGEEEGRAFFTMELLVGGHISALGPLEDNAEELEGFLRISSVAAKGLEYVHASKLVHRDLTPRNILLDGHGHARIMDFGLVYVSDATRDLTRTGYTLGTPQYMAPEQAKGTGISGKSDIYSFGAVLYRTATGRAPFEADNDQGVLYQHVHELPEPLEGFNPNLPRAIGDTVLEFLHKEPSLRPANPAEHLDYALERLKLEHFPSQYRGGRARTGEHPGGVAHPGRLRLAWEVQLPGEIAWGDAITGYKEAIAVGTRAGELCVLGANGGVRMADFSSGDELTAPASFDGETLVYCGWDGVTRAVEWRTGGELWLHRGRADIVAAPTAWRDLWLVAARDGCFTALKHGEPVWTHQNAGALVATPAIWGERAILTDEDGDVTAINLDNGKVMWSIKLGGMQATPCIARDPKNRDLALVIVASWQGEITALELKRHEHGWLPSEESRWEYDLEGEVWASPAVSGNVLILGSWAGEGGVLRALQLDTGDDLWTLQLMGRITASPIISRRVVYVASEAGEILALRLEDGAVLWRESVDCSVQGTPLIMNGALYVPLLDGRVRCYRL
jgi:eukaryotic-like serine/threonine-protein kinase